MTTERSRLLARVQAAPRDETLWAELYRHLHPKVYMLAFHLCGAEATLAEDLTQEAFLRMIEYDAIARLTSEEHAIGYLRATLRNLVRDHYKKANRLSIESIDATSFGDDRRMEGLIAMTFIDEDFAILEGLRSEDQRLMRLVLEGWTLTEIAQKMGLTYTATAVRLHRLKKKLRGDVKETA